MLSRVLPADAGQTHLLGEAFLGGEQTVAAGRRKPRRDILHALGSRSAPTCPVDCARVLVEARALRRVLLRGRHCRRCLSVDCLPTISRLAEALLFFVLIASVNGVFAVVTHQFWRHWVRISRRYIRGADQRGATSVLTRPRYVLQSRSGPLAHALALLHRAVLCERGRAPRVAVRGDATILLM